jgi:biopolymer transport protein ExbD
MIRPARTTSPADGAHIDIAPMIDCVFLLLIFFIVTSVFVEEPGVEVEKPDVSGVENASPDALLIAITAQDTIHFDGQVIPLEQVAPALKRATFSADTSVIIRADRGSSHGIFANVYTEAKRAGVAHVQFATARAGDTPHP